MEPVPSSADGGPIEYSGVRTIANFNPMSVATRTSSKNILADQFVENNLFEARAVKKTPYPGITKIRFKTQFWSSLLLQ